MEKVLLSQLLAATGATCASGVAAETGFDRVCLDSRQIRPGEVFWAVSGSRHDGHEFVEDAFNRGASACVVENRKQLTNDRPLVVVEHSQRALGDFARWYRQQRETLVIGVTGSVGKTTTREMIYAVLSADHTGIRSQQNFNNELGLPLTLLELGKEHEFAVLEMGAARVGDIADLTEIAHPEIGVITAIAPAHLTSFGSLDGVLRGKGELFEALPQTGFAVLPGDDPQALSLRSRAKCPVILVGEGSHNGLRATQVEMSARELSFTSDGFRYRVPVTGRHALSAALCAVAIGREVGMTAAAIADGFSRFTPAPGRCHVEHFGTWTVINDTYNANPASMRAACEMLRDWPGAQRRLLITGDMLELGELAADYHRELGKGAAEARIDHLLALGNHAEHVVQGAWDAGLAAHCLAECSELDALLAVLDCWLAEGDVILVKGSRGMKMERVVEWLRRRSEEESNRIARHFARACA